MIASCCSRQFGSCTVRSCEMRLVRHDYRRGAAAIIACVSAKEEDDWKINLSETQEGSRHDILWVRVRFGLVWLRYHMIQGHFFGTAAQPTATDH